MKKILIVAASLLLGLALVGCTQNVEPDPPAVVSIRLAKAPSDTVYLVNDTVLPSGAQISVTYDDGAEETVDVTEQMLRVPDMRAHGKKTAMITCPGTDQTVSYEILVVDRRALSAAALDNGNDGDWVYVQGDFLSNAAYRFHTDAELYSDGGIVKNAALTVSGKSVGLHGFHFQNNYTENNGAPVLTMEGVSNVALYDTTIENVGTNGFGPLYGMIATGGAADGSSLTIRGSALTDTHTARGDVPAIVGGGSAAIALDVKDSTFTAKSDPEAGPSCAFFNGVFSGGISDCTFSGTALNSLNLKGLRIEGNTFTAAANTQLMLGGAFTLKDNSFINPVSGDILYAGIYGTSGKAEIIGNTFDLGGEEMRHYGIRFLLRADWGMTGFDSENLTVTDNVFNGSGYYAVRYEQSKISYDFSHNSLNGNIVKEDD